MPQATALSPSQIEAGSRYSKATTAILLISLALRYKGFTVVPFKIRYIWGLLLLIHWKNLPFAWHLQVFAPLFSVLARRYRSYWGLYRVKNGERARELGFPKADWYISSVGNSPFTYEGAVVTRYFVGLADSDFNLHLSNSVYARNLDHSRMEICMRQFGQLFRVKAFSALLGGTSYMFLKEIPMLTRYTVETMIVAWDDRWFFELHRFTLPLSHKKARDTVVQTAQGERVLCTLAMSRITCKIQGKMINPARAVAYCGYGPDGTNWARTKELQKKGFKAQKAFLINETDEPSGVELYQENNKKALEIISRLGGHEVKSVWLELATVHTLSKQE